MSLVAFQECLVLILLLLSLCAFAGELLSIGESLDGADCIGRQVHSEFIRYQLKLESSETLLVELQPKKRAGSGSCSARGYTLSPRWKLLNRELSREEQPPFIQELCRRLVSSNYAIPSFESPENQGGMAEALSDEEAVGASSESIFMPLNERVNHNPMLLSYGVVLFLLGLLIHQTLCAYRLSHCRDGLALLAVSLAIRLSMSPLHLFNGADAGYEKLFESIGMGHPLYGKGVVLLMNSLYGIVGEKAELLLIVNAVISVLLPVLLWRLTSIISPENRWAPMFSGLALACLPLAIKLSATEIYILPMMLWSSLSLIYAAQFAREENWFFCLIAYVALAMAIQSRPEAISLAPLPVAMVFLFNAKQRKRTLMLLLSASVMLVAWRYVQIDASHAQRVFNADLLLSWSYWRGWLPHVDENAVVWGNWLVTPPLFYVLSVYGVWAMPTRVRSAALCLFVCCWVPIATKISPLADAYRLFLPLHLPLLLCCGFGAEKLVSRIDWRLLVFLFLGSVAFHFNWIDRLWVQQYEFRMARKALGDLPSEPVLQLGGHSEKWAKKSAVFSWLLNDRNDLQPINGMAGWLWRGPYCELQDRCAKVFKQCRVSPVHIEEVENLTDIDVQLSGNTVTMGLYRVYECSDEGDSQ